MVWPFATSSEVQNPSGPGPNPYKEHNGDQDTSKSRTSRSSFGISSTQVYGYPSGSNKALILPFCGGVDLDFLNLPRFETAERDEDPSAEDRHCQRMRMLGEWEIRSVDEYEETQIFDLMRWCKMRLVVTAWSEDDVGGGVGYR